MTVALALAAVLGAAAPASATQGSVPIQVATFVAAPDGLVASLKDFLGTSVDGEGIDFDGSTTLGRIDRVFTFSSRWIAGDDDAAPVDLSNQWTVPVSVASKPVGVAVVWINPSTVRPELADFVPDVDLAAKLADVPDDGYVVDDADRAAWFTLQQPRLLVLASGASGVSEETPLASYRSILAKQKDAPAPVETPDLGSILSVGTIAAVALVVILVLLVPMLRRRKADGDSE